MPGLLRLKLSWASGSGTWTRGGVGNWWLTGSSPSTRETSCPRMLRSEHLTNGSPPQRAAGFPDLGNKNTRWSVKSEVQISGPGHVVSTYFGPSPVSS